MCEQIETIQKTGKDFMQEFLIDKIGELKDKEPYVAFLMMAIGIEFLGKCLNNKSDWDTKNMTKKDFNSAINKLKPLKKYRNWDLYDKLRCGLAHSMMVKNGLMIKDKGSSSSASISCEEFYRDFKAACEEVMNMPNLPKKNLNDVYFTVRQENGSSITGNTANNI